ncbi:MAG: hypothetical protein O9284_01890 [Steroidobacteraceae bacterium]|nr:hypothetical protein [Steroidobacteraceae bacterium]
MDTRFLHRTLITLTATLAAAVAGAQPALPDPDTVRVMRIRGVGAQDRPLDPAARLRRRRARCSTRCATASR